MFTLFKPENVYINEKFEKNKGILVEDNFIVDIDEFLILKEKYPSADIQEWKDLIMVAGTVNVHNHCFQSLLRGIACDRPFLEWRDNALYKYSPRLQKEHIYGGALFAFGEMMKSGVTTVSDFFYLHNFGKESDEMIIKAANDLGIRLVLARTMYDWDGAPSGYVETIDEAVENTRSLAKKYAGNDMVSIIPAPHSLHAASLDMIKAGHKLAKELGCYFHIHVAEEPFEVDQVMAEYGLTPVELLDKIGVVDESMVIIHGVWLKESEIKFLGKKGAKLAYCPSSNMFLADGITDIVSMKNAGVTIGLGSDGACSNNRISVFEEMRMVALLQKAKTLDAMSVNYADAFKMGTENGGKILQLPIGKIEIGYKADFVGIKMNTMSMQPISKSGEQILPNIVYSMQPDAIAKVVVNGKLTVSDGKVLTVSEEEIIDRVKKIMDEIEA
ncbi:MAG TPA: S-adenosylhomocysteine deaminase [Lachnospiraceae bacterium]|nr:S-adenosylhomocysteine deaminase [Lachnospiraceae bacterium]